MKKRRTALLVISCLVLSMTPAFAIESAPQKDTCASEVVQDGSGLCVDPAGAPLRLSPEDNSSLQLLPMPEYPSRAIKRTANTPERGRQADKTFNVYLFWGEGCPHCEQEKKFLDKAVNADPAMVIKNFEVWYDKRNAVLLSAMLKAHDMPVSGVPITFIGDQVFAGFTQQTRQSIEEAVQACARLGCPDPGQELNNRGAGDAKGLLPASAVSAGTATTQDKGTSVDLPLFGKLDAQDTSLPVMTLVIAGLDSFNPCAFFVLLSLLGLLVHARSRTKMLLIGGVFVFFSGAIYFLFMAAWLNLFLIMGQVSVITTVAGVVSVLIAGINIKDFFIFKQGLSLTIPDSAKPRLFDRMRKLMRASSLPSVLLGTTVLAIVANSYELLCTAGFPMVFTRILTLQRLSTTTYYLYLLFYNIVYVIPLLIIVLGFTVTLGSRKLSEWQGRVLKLVSGSMMLGLGGVLLVNPALLSSVMASVLLLTGALGVSLIIALTTRKLGY